MSSEPGTKEHCLPQQQNEGEGGGEEDASSDLISSTGTESLSKRSRNEHSPDDRASADAASPGISENGEPAFKCAKKKKMHAIPALPADGRLLILDVEGGVTCRQYVKDYLTRYTKDNLSEFLSGSRPKDLVEALQFLEKDIGALPADHAARNEFQKTPCNKSDDGPIDMEKTKQSIKKVFLMLKKYQVDTPALLSLQGRMWKEGRKSGKIEGHIYPDFIPTIRRCKANGIIVALLSDTPVGEQKQMMRMSSQGDLTPFISSYFDTAKGGRKTDPGTFVTISKELAVAVEDIVFLSVNVEELRAASEAGVGYPLIRRKPANWSDPLTGQEKYPVICSMFTLFGGEDMYRRVSSFQANQFKE